MSDLGPFDALLDGPLRWRRWGAAAAAESRERNAPLAVLVGDALDAWTAHWLNAMRADAACVELLETAFVPVAAERSDHPGLAALAQQAMALTADAAGVPGLLILLPGDPPRALGAVPYGPLRDGAGRRGTARVLLDVAEGWSRDPDALRSEAARLAAQCDGLPYAVAGDGRVDAARVMDLAEAQLMAEAHALEGGFGATADGACALPRWPQPEKLRLLAALAARPGAAPSLRAHLDRSLAALAAGAIRDQLDGGFHRAAGTADWGEPLWERRLADQARLALAFIDGHRVTGQALHRSIAEQAMAWALHDLHLGPGRWAAGRHAIATGARGPEPGAWHRWTRAACADVVGADGARILAERFALDDQPGALAVRGALSADDARRLPELTARLSVARRERPAPVLDARDDLAAHGLVLAALSALSALPALSSKPAAADWRAAAEPLLERLRTTPPRGGRAQARACVALGLSGWDAHAAARWLPTTPDHGGWTHDDDPLVAPPPWDAEDTVDGPGAAGAVALAAAAMGQPAVVARIASQHAGLLSRAPSLAPSLVLALSLSLSEAG
jgi:uncharacterized protein